MADLIAIAYRDLGTAQRAEQMLSDLQKQQLISLADAVIVERRDDGSIKLHQTTSMTGIGAVGGALWGGLIGLLVLAPLLGMAVGAAAGAVGGKFTDIGIDDDFMKQVGSHLQPGNAALFLLVTQVTADKVIEAMAPAQLGGEIIQTSLNSEEEQHLRSAVEQARIGLAS